MARSQTHSLAIAGKAGRAGNGPRPASPSANAMEEPVLVHNRDAPTSPCPRAMES